MISAAHPPLHSILTFNISPLPPLLNELKVVKVVVVPWRDLDVVVVPRHLPVRALDGAVQLEGGVLLLATGLEHLREFALVICRGESETN